MAFLQHVTEHLFKLVNITVRERSLAYTWPLQACRHEHRPQVNMSSTLQKWVAGNISVPLQHVVQHGGSIYISGTLQSVVQPGILSYAFECVGQNRPQCISQ